MASTKLVELREEVATKRAALFKMFEDHPERDFSAEQVEDIRAKNKELGDLGAKLEQMQEVEGIAEQVAEAEGKGRETKGTLVLPKPGERVDEHGRALAMKSLGTLFVESDAFTKYDKSAQRSPTVELQAKDVLGYESKATLDTVAWPVYPQYLPGVQVQYPLRRPVVADLIPQGVTSAQQIVYMEETTVTNNAAAVAEGAIKPESALGFTQRNAQVRKLATVLPVTDELLQDQPGAQAYVDGRLRVFMALTEESQLVSGNGTAPNLLGIMNTPGIQTIARDAAGGEPAPDAVYRAMTAIRVTAFLEPNGIIFHPNDWRDIRLLRTADGIYIWGSPADTAPERIWGMNIVQTTVIPENTAIVAAFDTASQIFRKQEIAFSISDQHSDFFIRNMLMLRVEERLAFVIYRPSAFATVTGI